LKAVRTALGRLSPYVLGRKPANITYVIVVEETVSVALEIAECLERNDKMIL
jgi:hypothetical protein